MSNRNQISRRAFLTLAGASAAAGLAAACAPVAPAPTTGGGQGEAPKAAEPTAAPQEQQFTLTYVFPQFSGIPKDLASVQEALNQATIARINAIVKLTPLEFGAWGDKINLMNAGGEQYDLAYTANWTNDYYRNVSNGVFVELDDLLPARAPKYWSSMPVTTWQAAKVKGKLYAGINQQMFPKNWGFVARKDLAEKYGLDYQNATKWQDTEEWQKRVYEGEGGNVIPWGGPTFIFAPEIYDFAPIDDGIGWLVVDPDDESAQARRVHELPEFVEAWDLARKWYDAGWMVKEETPTDEFRANWKAGKHAIAMNPVNKPRGEVEAKNIYGYDMVQRALARNILTTPGITATMTGVSRTTVSAEKACEWLELVNTDKPVYNLLCIGVEGKHWRWKDQGKEIIEQIPDSGYNPTTDWMFGNQFLAYYREEYMVGAWDETTKNNDSALPSPTLGFVMDREPVKNEIAAVAAVTEEFAPFGSRGIPAADLPKVIQAMDDAGARVIQQEMQRQIELWKQNK